MPFDDEYNDTTSVKAKIYVSRKLHPSAAMLKLFLKIFSECLDVIYPSELEIKDTSEATHFVNFLNLCQRIHNIQITTCLCDKRDDLNFYIVNFPFLSSNIPSSPAYGVFVSRLVRYSRSSSDHRDFVKRNSILVAKQGFSLSRLHHAFKNCYGRHQDLIGKYDKSMSAKDVLSV